MGQPTNSDYSRAIAELTIARIWQEAGLPGRVPTGDGIHKSPFRDERTPSFSVFGRMRNWKDHGTGDGGGIVDFAKKCWSELSDEDFREKLIEVSGIIRSPKKTDAPVNGQPFFVGPDGVPRAAAAVIPKTVEKAAKAIEKRQQLAEAEERLYQEREALLHPELPKEKRNLPGWPDCVRDRFVEGWEYLRGDTKRQAEFAESRGWPVAWVEELLNLELISYPLERGFDSPDERWARRQKAFRVDVPLLSSRTVKELRPGVTVASACELRPIGYHQRIFVPARNGEPERKLWMFLPSFPKFAARSKYEKAIVEEGVKVRGLRYASEDRDGRGGEREPFITAAPFVLGDLAAPKVIVILEGQWDAITFFGACGWFHDTSPASGVAVFGVRGAQGRVPFLSYWRQWMLLHRPLAWVIADNDAAGGTWREAPAAKPGELRPPSFAEQLEAAGCRKVLVSWLKPGTWGKDFNDYYRAKKPGPDAMHVWMKKAGVLDAAGGWA